MLSNVVLIEYTTLAYLRSPRTTDVTATGATLHVTATIATGTTYWAVFDESSAKTAAEIITPTGAADSGNAPAQLTEDDFAATGLDTVANAYYVWFVHTEMTAAIKGRPFGALPEGRALVGPVIRPAIGPVISTIISGSVSGAALSVAPEFVFSAITNSQYIPLL